MIFLSLLLNILLSLLLNILIIGMWIISGWYWFVKHIVQFDFSKISDELHIQKMIRKDNCYFFDRFFEWIKDTWDIFCDIMMDATCEFDKYIDVKQTIWNGCPKFICVIRSIYEYIEDEVKKFVNIFKN